MERLTKRSKTGTAFFDDDGALIRGAGGAFHQKKDMTNNFIHQRFVALDKTIDRLAAYEDAMPLERAKELAQAEKDGRLVVLPCKVGDVVWVNDDCVRDWSTTPMPHKCWVIGIEITEKEKRFHVESYKTGRVFPFDLAKFGKTVFLTREEAEAALKKEGGGQ